MPSTKSSFGPASVASSSLQTVRNRVLSTVRKQLSDHSQELVSLLSNAAVSVLSYAGSLIFIVLVPILSFFFLKDGEMIRNSVVGALATGPRRERIDEIAAELNVLFAQYMRALVLLAAAAFVAYGSFFSLIGVPYALLLAAIAFPLEFIPMVGPFIAAIVILAGALVRRHTSSPLVAVGLGPCVDSRLRRRGWC